MCKILYSILLTTSFVNSFTSIDFCDVCMCRYVKSENGIIICDDGLPKIWDIVRAQKVGNYSLVIGSSVRKYKLYKADIDKLFYAVIIDEVHGIPEIRKKLNTGLFNVMLKSNQREKPFITKSMTNKLNSSIKDEVTASLSTSEIRATDVSNVDINTKSIIKEVTTNMDASNIILNNSLISNIYATSKIN
ncbi:MAG: hypothetical protein GY707_18780, partial [Desulfobacteraceae bacterium]|nr:hypothetical protein [Desulfobacteraceae bacterium]